MPFPRWASPIWPGSLRAAGHQVTAVDAVGEAVHQYTRVRGMAGRVLQHGLSADDIVAMISPTARVIGVSCMFSVDWLSSRAVINRIRASFPDALIVLGGEHVTALPEYVMEDCPRRTCWCWARARRRFSIWWMRTPAVGTSAECPESFFVGQGSC